MAKEEVLLEVKLDEGESVTSINTLRNAVKQLTKERNELNLQTDEGKARLKELNNEINRNNSVIKENLDALSKQRQNVGNYKADIQAALPQIDRFTGGLGSMTQGFFASTKAALAFIATPIGAVIAALGAAIGALTAYFKGSDEAQDKLAEGTAILGVAMDGLMVIVEKVGEVIFKTFEFLNAGVKAFIDFALPSMGAALDQVILQGKLIAKLQDDLENKENENLIKRAAIEQQVAKLRQAAITQEGEQKRKTIEQAIALEKQLSEISVDEAKRRLGVFLAETKAKGELTGEELRKRSELIAAVIKAETEQYESTLRFEKQIEALRDESEKKRQEQVKLFVEDNQKKLLSTQETEDASLQALSDKIGQEIQAENDKNALLLQTQSEYNDEEFLLTEEQTKRILAEMKQREANERMLYENRFRIASGFFGSISALLGKNTVEGKVAAIASIAYNTAEGISKAVQAGAGVPFPGNLLAILSGVTAVLAGAAQAKGVLSGGFAEGGYTGDGGKYEPAGVVHRGEYVVPQHLVRNPTYRPMINSLESARLRGYADGGMVTGFSTPDVQNTFSSYDFQRLSDTLSKMQIFVAVEDINTGQNNYANVVSRASF